MTDPVAGNRAMWDDYARAHFTSEFYNVERFRTTRDSLHDLEKNEVGDVSGKSLLHMQCHFGMDTLSWAGRGAIVTGMDFSPEAIRLAQSLAADLDIPATFILSDVYGLPDVLDEQFDIVFASYGVLCWLPDIIRWAQTVAHFVKPGGTFYIADFHPISWSFLAEDEEHTPYFLDKPETWQTSESYAGVDIGATHTETNWQHTIGDIVSALAGAGLRIEFLHEFPYSIETLWPFVEQGKDGLWRHQSGEGTLPLMFSIKATKS
ncbi:class I SAM-dependent methyltransferase [Chloroflexota bacterium]